MKNDAKRPWLATANESTTFVFDWSGIPPGHDSLIVGHGGTTLYRSAETHVQRRLATHERTIPFNGTLMGRWNVVTDRIIQKYLDAVSYKVDVLLYPFRIPQEPYDPGEVTGNTLAFVTHDGRHRAEASLGRCAAELSGSGLAMAGHVMVDVQDIMLSADYFWGMEAGNGNTISIDILAKHFWPRASRNWRGVIHNFLQGAPRPRATDRTPIFRPEIHRPKPSRQGCELSQSDVVVVGLLHGLLARGMRYENFRGPTEFRLVTLDWLERQFGAALNRALDRT